MPLVLSFVGGIDGLHARVMTNMADVAQVNNYFSFDGLGNTVIMGFFLYAYAFILLISCLDW